MTEEKQPTPHNLVPKHEVCTEEEVLKLLSKYNIKKSQLPKISSKDQAISHLELEPGTVIRIFRKGKTEPNSLFYRKVY